MSKWAYRAQAGQLVELTGPQAAMLERLRAAGGPLKFNGRARATIDALVGYGLATADYDADIDQTKGRLRWRITVTATDQN